ncbi:PAS domain-containing sensor histidine kinase [Synechococcus sp. UW140]|uniref:PAS domain-containing sensor histidine kinase n=1 Tax=Synechococcus sp. UW140 TaxID=368503 RepID=UPI000E0EFE25|nr:PAS domain-containing sensor histidine kinase [Synechococcus sp. UW140]
MPVDDSEKQESVQQDLLDQMRQSLGLLRVAFDSTDEAMLILDHKQTIRWANQKAADLCSKGMTALLLGKPLSKAIPFYSLKGELLPADSEQHPCHRFEDGDGTERLLIANNEDQSGSTSQTLSLLLWRHITNLREPFLLLILRDLDPIEQALLKQRIFIQALAHELRTPLAILSGSLKRLSRIIQNDKRVLSNLETATSESRRVCKLVDKLMLLSDLDTGQFNWAIEETSLSEALEEWRTSLPKEKAARIKFRFDPKCRYAKIDRQAFCIVLDQLLDNSLHFSDQKATVEISARLDAETVLIFFEDSGPGFTDTEQAEVNSIFERFKRLEEHRSNSRPEGSGLGLAIVNELMQGMGGRVEVKLRTPRPGPIRQGGCIVLSLPFSGKAQGCLIEPR